MQTNSKALFLPISLMAAIALASSASSADPTAVERKSVVSEEQVEINVPTNGCTGKDSFSVKVDEAGKVELRRVEPDHCKGWFPSGEWVTYSWSELGLDASKFRGAYLAPDSTS